MEESVISRGKKIMSSRRARACMCVLCVCVNLTSFFLFLSHTAIYRRWYFFHSFSFFLSFFLSFFETRVSRNECPTLAFFLNLSYIRVFFLFFLFFLYLIQFLFLFTRYLCALCLLPLDFTHTKIIHATSASRSRENRSLLYIIIIILILSSFFLSFFLFFLLTNEAKVSTNGVITTTKTSSPTYDRGKFLFSHRYAIQHATHTLPEIYMATSFDIRDERWWNARRKHVAARIIALTN